MPFALVVIGLLCVMSAIKGTQKQLGAQLVGDFTGSDNFAEWMVALVLVGCLGYVPQLEKFSRAFLALCIISIVVAHNGVLQQFFQAIQAGPVAPQGQVSLSAQTQTASGSQSGLAGALGAASNVLTFVPKLFGLF